MESDRCENNILMMNGTISIHALLWRATLTIEDMKTVLSISIHALLWRATGDWDYAKLKDLLISIHALLWRATRHYHPKHLRVLDFNPRSPMESDVREKHS